MADSDSGILTRVVALEVSQSHTEGSLTRLTNITLPSLEDSIKALTSEIQGIRESRIRAEEQAKGFKDTLDTLTETLKGVPGKSDVEVVATEVHEIKTKQDEHDKLVTVWKTKGSIIGFSAVAVVSLAFSLMGAKVKQWLGL